MGDDWDPFAVDGGEEVVEQDLKPSGKVAEGRISKPDLDCVAESIAKMVRDSTPWRKAPNPTPDLGWYYPTCSFEDWKHTDVKVELGQGIAYIILNRPDSNNMISDSVIAGLLDAVFLLYYRKNDIRMAIFMGEGKFFCGGKELSADGMDGFTKGGVSPDIQKAWKAFGSRAEQGGAFPDGRVDLVRVLQAKFWHTLSMLPQFTLCLIGGSVVGEGIGFPACCDMCISVSGAYFNLSDVTVGSLPAILAPYIVAKIGTGFAKVMFCTADNITAEKAKFMGLVSEVVDTIEEAHKKIKELAEVLTACGPRSVEAAKQLVVGVAGQQITEDIMFYTGAMLAMVTISDEARDGMVCLQARKPKPWEEEHAVIKTLY